MKQSGLLKKIIALSLCAAVSATMTACGDKSTSSDAQNSSSSTSSAENSSSAESSPEESSDPFAGFGDTSEDTTPLPDDEPYTLGGELTDRMIALSRYNEGNKVRLASVIRKLQSGEDVTVAYIGGSITQGSSAGEAKCYAKLTTEWLQQQFPDANINYVNAGIGATGSFIGLARVDKDVLSYDPDLVFVEFSVNDTTQHTSLNKDAYAALLRKIWNYSTSPAIVTIAMTQENGTSFMEHHAEIIKNFDLPMISYKDTILDVIDNGHIKWKDISNDNIHPNVPGHALLSNLITCYLQDVIDDVDNISGEESDFTVDKIYGMRYMNLQLLDSTLITPTNMGGFEDKDFFSNFYNLWYIEKENGQFTDEDAIEFEFDGTMVYLLIGMLTQNSTQADVYVDGELVNTIDCNFSGGWGDYADFVYIVTGLSEGTHTLKIAPKSQQNKASFYLAGVIVG